MLIRVRPLDSHFLCVSHLMFKQPREVGSLITTAYGGDQGAHSFIHSFTKYLLSASMSQPLSSTPKAGHRAPK